MNTKTPKSVKVYSTLTCPYCVMEKKFLEQKNVQHEVVYVDLNPLEAQKMIQKTGQMGEPVTEIEYDGKDSQFVIGFDPGKLSDLLNLAK